jgi:hypothetical protein
MVAEPCSAFHNTIIRAFIWLSLINIQKLRFQLEQFAILLISLITVVLLNAQDEDDSDVLMPDVRHLIAECPRKDAPGAACGVYYADLRPRGV